MTYIHIYMLLHRFKGRYTMVYSQYNKQLNTTSLSIPAYSNRPKKFMKTFIYCNFSIYGISRMFLALPHWIPVGFRF